MNKLNCIENFHNGTLSYLYFVLNNMIQLDETKEYLFMDGMIENAKMAFISNSLLAIKEDLIQNNGYLLYESKLFLEALEESVSFIATKCEDGYKIGAYHAGSAEELVSLIRNKIAHGDYYIDGDNAVLNIEGKEVAIKIDDLATFVIDSFRKIIKKKQTNEYKRDCCVFVVKDYNRTAPIKTDSEIRHVIESMRSINFTLKSKDGSIISEYLIGKFENAIKIYKDFYGTSELTEAFSIVRNQMDRLGCEISVTSKSFKQKDAIPMLTEFIRNSIIDFKHLNYRDQIQLIGEEVQRYIEPSYNSFNAVYAHIKNLMLLDAIKNTKTLNAKEVINTVSKKYNNPIKVSYDEVISAIIATFNALYAYPLDDVYKKDNAYKLNRADEFDFGKLDLSFINPSLLIIDTTQLEEYEAHYNNLVKSKQELKLKLEKGRENLEKVKEKGNSEAVEKINNTINSATFKLLPLTFEVEEARLKLEAMKMIIFKMRNTLLIKQLLKE